MSRLAVLALVAVLFLPNHAIGQSTTLIGRTNFTLTYFPSESRDFQGLVATDAQIAGLHLFNNSGWGLTGYIRLGMTRYLKNETKVDGNPLQTEASKVFEFSRELVLAGVFMPTWGRIDVGAWIGRRSVHWMDRDCECFFNGFPKEFRSAEEVLGRLRKEKKLPGIAYHDGLRPHGRISIKRYTLAVIGPAYRWHTVTLPYHGWRIRFKHTRSNLWGGAVVVKSVLYAGGILESALDVSLEYYPVPFVSFGIEAGTIPYPGYERPLRRVAIKVGINLSETQ